MLSCVTRNQIFRCSALPLSLMCECWIVKFTARCRPPCGTQESTAAGAFTAARGDKRLSFQKVYHRAINKDQQSPAAAAAARSHTETLDLCCSYSSIYTNAWWQSHNYTLFSGTVSKGSSVYLIHSVFRKLWCCEGNSECWCEAAGSVVCRS